MFVCLALKYSHPFTRGKYLKYFKIFKIILKYLKYFKSSLTLDMGTLADLSAGVFIWVSISVNTVHVVTKLRWNINFRDGIVINVTYLIR